MASSRLLFCSALALLTLHTSTASAVTVASPPIDPTVAATESAAENLPSVAYCRGSNQWMAVWQAGGLLGPHIHGVFVSPSGMVGPLLQLSPEVMGERHTTPDVACAGNNRFVVVWRSSIRSVRLCGASPCATIAYTIINPDRPPSAVPPMATVTEVEQLESFFPRIACHLNNCAVVFSRPSQLANGTGALGIIRATLSGDVVTYAVAPSIEDGGGVLLPDIAVSPVTGRYLAAYLRRDSNTRTITFAAQRFSPTATDVIDRIPLPGEHALGVLEQLGPSVAYAPGRYLIAYGGPALTLHSIGEMDSMATSLASSVMIPTARTAVAFDGLAVQLVYTTPTMPGVDVLPAAELTGASMAFLYNATPASPGVTETLSGEPAVASNGAGRTLLAYSTSPMGGRSEIRLRFLDRDAGMEAGTDASVDAALSDVLPDNPVLDTATEAEVPIDVRENDSTMIVDSSSDSLQDATTADGTSASVEPPPSGTNVNFTGGACACTAATTHTRSDSFAWSVLFFGLGITAFQRRKARERNG